MHLLLIEDEVGASELLAHRLLDSGFRTTRVRTEAEALMSVHRDRVAALLLDAGSSCQSPVQSIRVLRQGGLSQPMLVLAARGDWRDRVDALDAGADDYVSKPVRSEEVAARLRAVIRRSAGQSENRILLGGLDLDLKLRCAWLDGNCLNLSRNEFRLLRTLVLGNGQLVLRETIRAVLASGRADLTENAVEVQIGRLRRKIGRDWIRTVRGLGYRLDIGDMDEDAQCPERHPCRQEGYKP